MTYSDELAQEFKTAHGCRAQFMHTVPVREVFSGNKIWDGAVWLFKLTGHPKAKFGYAWLHPNAAGDDLQITTVLEMGGVDSAPRAIRRAVDQGTLTAQRPASRLRRGA